MADDVKYTLESAQGFFMAEGWASKLEEIPNEELVALNEALYADNAYPDDNLAACRDFVNDEEKRRIEALAGNADSYSPDELDGILALAQRHVGVGGSELEGWANAIVEKVNKQKEEMASTANESLDVEFEDNEELSDKVEEELNNQPAQEANKKQVLSSEELYNIIINKDDEKAVEVLDSFLNDEYDMDIEALGAVRKLVGEFKTDDKIESKASDVIGKVRELEAKEYAKKSEFKFEILTFEQIADLRQDLMQRNDEESKTSLKKIDDKILDSVKKYNNGELFIRDASDLYVFQEILKSVKEDRESEEDQKAIENATEKCAADVKDFEEYYGIDSNSLASPEKIKENMKTLDSMVYDNVDYPELKEVEKVLQSINFESETDKKLNDPNISPEDKKKLQEEKQKENQEKLKIFKDQVRFETSMYLANTTKEGQITEKMFVDEYVSRLQKATLQLTQTNEVNRLVCAEQNKQKADVAIGSADMIKGNNEVDFFQVFADPIKNINVSEAAFAAHQTASLEAMATANNKMAENTGYKSVVKQNAEIIKSMASANNKAISQSTGKLMLKAFAKSSGMGVTFAAASMICPPVSSAAVSGYFLVKSTVGLYKDYKKQKTEHKNNLEMAKQKFNEYMELKYKEAHPNTSFTDETKNSEEFKNWVASYASNNPKDKEYKKLAEDIKPFNFWRYTKKNPFRVVSTGLTAVSAAIGVAGAAEYINGLSESLEAGQSVLGNIASNSWENMKNVGTNIWNNITGNGASLKDMWQNAVNPGQDPAWSEMAKLAKIQKLTGIARYGTMIGSVLEATAKAEKGKKWQTFLASSAGMFGTFFGGRALGTATLDSNNEAVIENEIAKNPMDLDNNNYVSSDELKEALTPEVQPEIENPISQLNDKMIDRLNSAAPGFVSNILKDAGVVDGMQAENELDAMDYSKLSPEVQQKLVDYFNDNFYEHTTADGTVVYPITKGSELYNWYDNHTKGGDEVVKEVNNEPKAEDVPEDLKLKEMEVKLGVETEAPEELKHVDPKGTFVGANENGDKVTIINEGESKVIVTEGDKGFKQVEIIDKNGNSVIVNNDTLRDDGAGRLEAKHDMNDIIRNAKAGLYNNADPTSLKDAEGFEYKDASSNGNSTNVDEKSGSSSNEKPADVEEKGETVDERVIEDNLALNRTYNDDGSYYDVMKNADGDVISRVEYSANGEVSSRYEYSTDNNGNKVITRTFENSPFGEKGSVAVSVYDKDNHLLSSELRGSSGELLKAEYAQIGEDGSYTLTKETYTNGVVSETEVKKYDPEDKLVSEEIYTSKNDEYNFMAEQQAQSGAPFMNNPSEGTILDSAVVSNDDLAKNPNNNGQDNSGMSENTVVEESLIDRRTITREVKEDGTVIITTKVDKGKDGIIDSINTYERRIDGTRISKTEFDHDSNNIVDKTVTVEQRPDGTTVKTTELKGVKQVEEITDKGTTTTQYENDRMYERVSEDKETGEKVVEKFDKRGRVDFKSYSKDGVEVKREFFDNKEEVVQTKVLDENGKWVDEKPAVEQTKQPEQSVEQKSSENSGTATSLQAAQQQQQLKDELDIEFIKRNCSLLGVNPKLGNDTTQATPHQAPITAHNVPNLAQVMAYKGNNKV